MLKTSRESVTSPAKCESMTDEEIIAGYQIHQERTLFLTLVGRYEREIYSYLRRYIGHTELAEDAFQGTFLQVHLKCHQFDPGRRFRPWLYAIATNQAIDVQRRNKRHRMVSLDHSNGGDREEYPSGWSEKLVGDSPDPADAASSQEHRDWVNSSVASLSCLIPFARPRTISGSLSEPKISTETKTTKNISAPLINIKPIVQK